VPDLHDLITVLHAPDLVLSDSDGQLRTGAHGWYSRDCRAITRLEIEIVDRHTTTIGLHLDGASAVTVHSAVGGEDGSDPTIMLNRHRAVSPSALTDRIELTNYGSTAATVTLVARVGTDLAAMGLVRSGRPDPPIQPLLHGDEVRWEREDITVSLRCTPAWDSAQPSTDAAALTWTVLLDAGQHRTILLAATCTHAPPAGFAPTPAPMSPQWTVEDHPLVAANLADLNALLMADPVEPGDLYAGAGAPWYLTLFGRDALWTARLLLPLGTELAAGTLRTLARRQGTGRDPETEEAPGKILHEARPGAYTFASLALPALYYGTIDATALWVCLLHDAWRAGLPRPEVEALLPNLIAAMEWITGPDADPDGDGLLEYAGSAHGALANQGWKDSPDSIRHLDGRFATPPLALCEVQGYAYAAAVSAAALAAEFALPHGDGWLDWARRLRTGFHAAFWLRDEVGPYVAIAMDKAKEPVTGAASNMAHLLGTGILDTDQAAAVAERLAAPDLTTPYGLRTLTTTSAAYNPVSYHCGSIWPHDTAIAVTGLAAEGHDALATTLAEGLLRAADFFDGRPPELYGLPETGPPVHYPSACRPQAWSAAAVIAAVSHLR
jgi:glycogen debranching enzyme